jgi:NDMA-dependent alcohol dehydrogenase
MRVKAAIAHAAGQDWSVEHIEIGEPRAGEVQVRTAYAGLCHSDEHVLTGDLVPPPESLAMFGVTEWYPVLGGHEGSGIVEAVGDGVRAVKPGDHVSCSFVPVCGRCFYCATGRSNLCDLGAGTLVGGMITDGTFRHHTLDGTPITTMAKLGTFAETLVVAEDSVIKVDADLPLSAVCLVSCSVATGFGSSVNRADVRPGDTVVIVGIGGVGMNAVQGARAAGATNIVAVDPVEFKREKAMEFGATHSAASMEDAVEVVKDLTWGRMANSVILTPGLLAGEMIQPAADLTAKGGTIVATAIAPMTQQTVQLSLVGLTGSDKQLRGSLFGSGSPRAAIPELLMMYRNGRLKLDELITKEYTLDQINEGYQDMRDGKNIRGVIKFG